VRRGGLSPNRRVTLPHMEQDTATLEAPESTDELVEEELLVEEISIDGMCGVY
jgi:mycofactocin precursor